MQYRDQLADGTSSRRPKYTYEGMRALQWDSIGTVKMYKINRQAAPYNTATISTDAHPFGLKT